MQLKAIVFDWAGTTIDYGSRAPMGAFVDVFAQFKVDISVEEARRPMGLPKWDHIKALISHPDIAARWHTVHGNAPTDADVDRIYEVFVPLNRRVVTDYADLIPGTAETVADARARGLKIGSTTGYTREIMEPLLPLARAQGYAPDNLVCAGDLSAGRPTPLMMYKCFVDLGVWPSQAVVKVDDTVPGIAEGLAAGCWTVGVAMSGNAMGMSLEQVNALSEVERSNRRAQAMRELVLGGAHYVVDTIADLPPVLDVIEGRLARGEKP
jgi:phosphonoacetaldehyde hydrolase